MTRNGGVHAARLAVALRPGARVRLESKKLFWRRRKLKIEGRILLEDGSVVCSATLAGLGVVR